ncbi:MAG: hypothetical protein U9O98_09150 [Asgard group archaeon]|nr:hypothetical protein [Asgard group archaeon]
MKLTKILKKRKAMTPLMIGLIVAASVIAVLFIVMAAVIPTIDDNVSMHIPLATVQANASNHQVLIFRVICDYDAGEIYRVEILKDGEDYGYNPDISEEFHKNEVKYIQVDYFLVTENVPTEERSEGHLVFQVNTTYTLRVFYQELDASFDDYTDITFTFQAYED